MASPHLWNVYLENENEPSKDGRYIGTIEAYTVRGALRLAAKKYGYESERLDVIMTDIDHTHHNRTIGEIDHHDPPTNGPIQP